MFHKVHRARGRALLRIINPEDRSLKRVRYVKIAVPIEGKGVWRGKIIAAKNNRVVATVRIIHRSIGRRPDPWYRSHVLGLRFVVKVGIDPLNLGNTKVADIDLIVPRVKLESQERRSLKIALRD